MPSLQELGRTDNWWDSKIPPVLALCYAAALVYDVPAAAILRCLALIVFVGLCAGSYGHIVNDAFDIEADRKAGKSNQMARFAPWQRFAFCALTLALGFAPALIFPYSRLSLALLAVEYLLPTIYSVPPLRLKERGALGILCDSMGAHAVPCLYAISVMASEAARPAAQFAWIAPALAAAGFVWALCLGVKGIVIHEFQDRASDLQAGVSTLATGLEFQTVRRPVNRVYAVELCAFLGVLIVLFPVAPILPAIAAVYVAMLCVKVSRNWDFFVYGRSPAATVEWWRFSHPFYECYFPLILAAQVSWRHPWLAFLPVLQILAFKNNYRRRFGECLSFLRHVLEWMIWRGQLHLDGGAKASVSWAGWNGTRIKIARAGSQPWQIRLMKTYGPVRLRGRYKVTLKLRSADPLQITFGVWENHAPWIHLGLIETVPLSREWKTIERTFTATEDEEHAFLGLWLGGETGTVDIKRCSIRQAGMAAAHCAREAPSPGLPVPYRIFVGASCWNLNGVNVFSEHLVRGLESQGFDARILMTERQTELVKPPADLMPVPADVRVEDLPVAPFDSWSTHWVTLIRYLSRHSPCIFVPNSDYRHSCVSPKLPTGVCIVGIVHSDDPVHYEHVARLGRYWDAIVCVSEAIARKVTALDASFAPRLHVISYGLAAPVRCPERSVAASDPAMPLRVVYHGVLNTHQKRILDLAAILDECARRGIPVHLTVAGDGPERDALLQACQPHVRSGAFHYAGLLPHAQIEEMLRQQDVYLLPSAFEGLPYAMLEAMAQGCIPVVSDIESGAPELIRNGVNGYRIPVGDIAAFAKHLQNLHADPDLRALLAAEAHRTVLGSKFDVHTMTASYVRLFNHVIDAAANTAYQRPAGRIAPPPEEVAGVSIFPMDHRREVEYAERRLMGPQVRPSWATRWRSRLF